jgi:hypothetical protein
MPKATLEEFAILVRRTGMKLTDADVAELYGVWGYLEGMLERLRAPAPALEAEPAHVFKPQEF